MDRADVYCIQLNQGLILLVLTLSVLTVNLTGFTFCHRCSEMCTWHSL
jgi:hypothetical protein